MLYNQILHCFSKDMDEIDKKNKFSLASNRDPRYGDFEDSMEQLRFELMEHQMRIVKLEEKLQFQTTKILEQEKNISALNSKQKKEDYERDERNFELLNEIFSQNILKELEELTNQILNLEEKVFREEQTPKRTANIATNSELKITQLRFKEEEFLSSQTNIYILKLAQGKYYIGRAQNPTKRYQEHLNGHGSTWTKKYEPISLIEVIPAASPFDEDKYTKIYMDKYGINNVRGGTYVTEFLDDVQLQALRKELWGAKGKCTRCGRSTHFAKDCSAKLYVDGGLVEAASWICEKKKSGEFKNQK